MAVVNQLSHPLVQQHLTRLRDKSARPQAFRSYLRRLVMLLAYEATQNLDVAPCEVETPLATAEGRRLTQRIGLAPILRAGLGMVDPILDLLPEAEVWHLGLYRDEETAEPVKYYSKLPEGRPVDVALVLDPMLATGGSASLAINAMRDWGVEQVKLLSILASSPGVETIHDSFPDVEIFVCGVDPELDERKFIVPGLGDAGDRSFNTEGA